jgi:hypothetical protein
MRAIAVKPSVSGPPPISTNFAAEFLSLPTNQAPRTSRTPHRCPIDPLPTHIQRDDLPRRDQGLQ